ncbi:hypothetical protein Pst134EA_022750 [Puccinia striiformis f. sp. tritici]|uniref:hypothetical protein n=1 Tax=Puccinia striiformis f. sp. tritici TaxID=168172 RepID=UPI0020080653|nr:hypothetical protein Pst134EA_022750 [Puccinia striiformis f. sp. tritici]KAH9455275.1 hypothetical protein Pst134EA_022750 [Puccinia striiformis f. sp. tritici]
MSSTSFNFLPSIPQILSTVPPGEDPFSFGLRMLDASVYPTVDPGTFSILIVMSFLHACTIILSVLVIILPFLRPRGRRKQFWIVKKFTIGSTTDNYWMPNTSLALAFFQLLIGCVCEVYTYLSYMALKSPGFANKMSIGVWIQFIWLYNFYSYFITSWGAISTCLSSPQPATVLRFPILRKAGSLYTICIVIPLLVTLFTLAWSVALGFSYHKIQADVERVRNVLIQASSERKSGHRVNLRQMLQIFEDAKTLINTTRTLIFRLKYNSFLWAGIWTFTAAMYTSAVCPLITMFRTCYKRMEEMKTTEQPALSSQKSPPRGSSSGERNHERVGAALRRSYRFLMCHCAVMTISIMYNFCICLVVGIHSEHVIVVSEWRALGAWLFLVGGAFSAIAMLSQTWRSYIKFDFSQEVTDEGKGMKDEPKTSNKHRWNTLASGSSGNPTISELGVTVEEDKIESAEDILVICIPRTIADNSKADCNVEILRE